MQNYQKNRRTDHSSHLIDKTNTHFKKIKKVQTNFPGRRTNSSCSMSILVEPEP